MDEFNLECGHFWFALFAEEFDWLILCTKYDFIVVAGKTDFLTQFLGCSPDEAFLKFEKFTERDNESEVMQNLWLSTLHRFRLDYPAAIEGTKVKF